MHFTNPLRRLNDPLPILQIRRPIRRHAQAVAIPLQAAGMGCSVAVAQLGNVIACAGCGGPPSLQPLTPWSMSITEPVIRPDSADSRKLTA